MTTNTSTNQSYIIPRTAVPNPKVTAYLNGTLVWGSEPSLVCTPIQSMHIRPLAPANCNVLLLSPLSSYSLSAQQVITTGLHRLFFISTTSICLWWSALLAFVTISKSCCET